MMGRNAQTQWLSRVLQILVVLLLLPTLVVSAQPQQIDLGKTVLLSRGYTEEHPYPDYTLGNGNSWLVTSSWKETDVAAYRVVFASQATNLLTSPNNDNDCTGGESNRYCSYDLFAATQTGSEGMNYTIQQITLPPQSGYDGDSLFPTLSKEGNYVVFQSSTDGWTWNDLSDPAEFPRQTDIFFYDLTATNLQPILISVKAPNILDDDKPYQHSGNVQCTYMPNAPAPTCVFDSQGAVRPQFGYAHPVADLYVDRTSTLDPNDVYKNVFVAFESIANHLKGVSGDDLNSYIKDIFLGSASTSTEKEVQLLTKGCRLDSNTNPPIPIYDQPSDGDSYHPVFVPDRLVDSNNNGQLDTGEWMEPSGRYLIFVSRATNLDCNITSGYPPDDPNKPFHQRRANIFLLDRTSGLITLLTVGTDGLPGNGASEYPAVTLKPAEGPNPARLYVAFQSSATNLVNGDNNGYTDIFLFSADFPDLTNRTIERVSLPSGSNPPQANLSSYTPTISLDGRIVAFTSYASNLIEGDTNNDCNYTTGNGIEGTPTRNCPDIFARDVSAGQTWRVSLTSDGQQAGRNSNFAALSASGRFVTFSSQANMEKDGLYADFGIQTYVRDQGNPPGNPNLQPTYKDFGVVLPNQTASHTFRMSFLSPLKVSSLTVTQGTSSYSLSGGSCTGAPPPGSGWSNDTAYWARGSQCDFTIQFTAPNTLDTPARGTLEIILEDPLYLPRERKIRVALVGSTVRFEPRINEAPQPATLAYGATRTEVFNIYNDGNYPDSFGISVEHVGGCPFAAVVSPTELNNISPGQYGTVTVQITATQPNCQDDNMNKTRLRATSRGASAYGVSSYNDRILETASGEVVYSPVIVAVTPDPLLLNSGATGYFTFTVRNSGNFSDSFSISFANNEFDLWLDPADAPKLANLAPGAEVSVKVWVRATRPNYQDHDIRVIFTSQGDPSKKDERTVRVTSGLAYIYLPLVRK